MTSFLFYSIINNIKDLFVGQIDKRRIMTTGKFIKVRTTENEYARYKEAALDQRYMNFSQFVRDAIEEKIKNFNDKKGI